MRPRVAWLVLFTFLSGAAARAQAPAVNRAEPWRGPSDLPGTQPSANRARITSGETATQPTPAEQKEARALAAAIFAKPAAAQRAGQNAAPALTPDWAAVQPREEWTDKVGVGGRGVKVTQPF